MARRGAVAVVESLKALERAACQPRSLVARPKTTSPAKCCGGSNRPPIRASGRSTTHIFDNADPYIESDAVFAVKDSLICHFVRHDESDEASRQFALDPPLYTVEFDFVLKKGGLT